MIRDTLYNVWRFAGRSTKMKVRFNDWTYQIKYFVITGESYDGKRFFGELDTGEKMSFPKRSRGWTIYSPGIEYSAHAV